MRRTARAVAVVVVGLSGGCGGDVEFALPGGVEQLPGATVFAMHGPAVGRLQDGTRTGPGPVEEPDARIPAAGWPALAGSLRADVPGFLYAAADQVESGWPHLGASRSFREAWRDRPFTIDAPGASWAFVDLQILVDELSRRLDDPRLQRLIEPLALRSLEWAMASIRNGAEGGLVVEGLVRASRAEVGIVPMLGGSAAPSLLGPPADGEELRAELRIDAAAARRAVDAWMAADQGSGAISVRDAMTGVVGEVGQALLRQIDGTVSIVVAEDRVMVAFGLRAPDDARDALDRFLRPDGADAWQAPAGVRAVIDGARVVLVQGDAPLPAAGGPPIDAALRIDAPALGALTPFAAWPLGRIRLEVRHADSRTLRVHLLLAD